MSTSREKVLLNLSYQTAKNSTQARRYRTSAQACAASLLALLKSVLPYLQILTGDHAYCHAVKSLTFCSIQIKLLLIVQEEVSPLFFFFFGQLAIWHIPVRMNLQVSRRAWGSQNPALRHEKQTTHLPLLLSQIALVALAGSFMRLAKVAERMYGRSLCQGECWHCVHFVNVLFQFIPKAVQAHYEC